MKLSKASAVAVAAAIAVSNVAFVAPAVAGTSAECMAGYRFSNTAYALGRLTGWSAIWNWGLHSPSARRQVC